MSQTPDQDVIKKGIAFKAAGRRVHARATLNSEFGPASNVATKLWISSVASRATGLLLGVAGLGLGAVELLEQGSQHETLLALAGSVVAYKAADALRATAVWLRGRNALETFESCQALARLEGALVPFRMHLDLEQGGAVANCVDPLNGIFLVRKPGQQQFEVVNRRGFEHMRDAISRAGGNLDLVMVLDHDGTAPTISIAHYRAGRLHGDTPEHPAIATWNGVEVMRNWYCDGQKIDAPLVDGVALSQSGVDLKSGLDPWAMHAT